MLHTCQPISKINYLFVLFSFVIYFSHLHAFLDRCPPGHMIRVNGTRKSCVYTLCATRPCHRGTCVAQSPSKFTCHCPEGYRGRHCETTLAIYREDVGLSFSSLFAICICFMALLGTFRLFFKRLLSLEGGVSPETYSDWTVLFWFHNCWLWDS